MPADEATAPGYSISTDKDRLDVPLIHRYLSESSYWARGRPLETVRASIRNSLCFGIYGPGGEQAGFARVVTDYATFAWLCDVFVVEEHRGRGLGRQLVEAVVGHTDLRSLRRILLATKDAHALYERHGGFTRLTEPGRWMERLRKG